MVTTDPSVVISLLLPNGTEITAANASAFGFNYSAFAVLNDPGVAATTIYGRHGYHVLIDFPPNQSPGVYTVKANAASVLADAAMLVTYLSTSGVRTGIMPDLSVHNLGDVVVFSGLVFDDNAPITGATLQTSVWRAAPVTSGLAVSNYVLTGQTTIDANTGQYQYKADLVNSGSALTNVVASATTSTLGAVVVQPALAFGDAGPGTSTSVTSFWIQLGPSQPFDSTMLTWTFVAQDSGLTIPLIDGGTLDGAAGDGIYTGSMAPSAPGGYVAELRTTGVSNSGVPFSRFAKTSFTVIQPIASLSPNSVADSSVGTPITQVNVTATVNVQIAGTYEFSAELAGSNGRIAVSKTSVTLATGSQTISAPFSASQLLPLGNGPYERQWVRLRLVDSAGIHLADQQVDAGPSAAYALSSIDQGPVYFTGQNTAVGMDLTGSGSFDILRVQLGVVTPPANCDWSGTLTTLTGTSLAFVAGSATMAGGTGSITLDFNGNLIAQSGLSGPYLVTRVGMTCDNGSSILLGQSWQTGTFTASQFHLVPQSISLSLLPTPLSVNAGSAATVNIGVTSAGGFSDIVTVAISGLPQGVTAQFNPTNQVPTMGTLNAVISTPSNLALGSYPFTITGTSTSLSTTLNATIAITAPDFSISVTPASVTEASTSQSSLSVTVTPLNGLNGTIGLSATGLPAGAVASFQPSNVSGANPSTSTLTIATTAVQPGSYPFTITGLSGTISHSIPATLVVSATALPYPWSTQGIGTNSAGGSATNTNGLITVTGPGNTLSSTADSFQFTSQPFSGDGTLIARVASLQNAPSTAKAGLMFRQSSDPASPAVYFGFNGSTGLILQSRATSGAAYSTALTGTATTPLWLKLVQAGSTFTASTSNFLELKHSTSS